MLSRYTSSHIRFEILLSTNGIAPPSSSSPPHDDRNDESTRTKDSEDFAYGHYHLLLQLCYFASSAITTLAQAGRPKNSRKLTRRKWVLIGTLPISLRIIIIQIYIMFICVCINIHEYHLIYTYNISIYIHCTLSRFKAMITCIYLYTV